MARKSSREKIEEIKSELRKQSEKIIRGNLCRKCGGVVVRSYVTSLMAQKYGKKCKC